MKVYIYKRYRIRVETEGYRVLRGEESIGFYPSIDRDGRFVNALDNAVRAIEEHKAKAKEQKPA